MLAAALWIPQALLLAWAVQRMADGASKVGWIAFGVFLLGVGRAGCEAAGACYLFADARERLSRLRAEAVAALAATSPLDRERPASGLAASVLAEQAEAVLPELMRYRPARWRVMVLPPLILLAVLWLSWVAALILAVAAPLIPLFMMLIGWRAKAASEAQLLEQGGMNAFLLDRLRGLRTLRALDAVELSARRLRESAQALQRRTMTVLRVAFLSSAVLELFAALGVAMVAVYVGFYLLGSFNFGVWRGRLSLGEGLFILLLAPAFFEPLRELSAVWHDRAAGAAAREAMGRLARRGLPLVGAGDAPVSDVERGGAPSVRVRGLRFGYPGEEAWEIAQDWQVAAGECVALFGPSGAGKSTLLALIAGLMPPVSGCIEIGGVPLSEWSAAALRARIGWMGQRPHVFAGPVAANVSLGRAGIGPAQVHEAIRLAGLERVAQAHPGATLGEGGSGLSGGEAARLALARLAANTQADLLLLDEPTAHLDRETARSIGDAVLALARGRTLIVATHDPVLAACMDRIIPIVPRQVADGQQEMVEVDQ